MNSKLFFQALIKFLIGILTVGALVFIPAGGFDFTHGWIFIGVLFAPMLLVGAVLMIKDPALLKKRLDGDENESAQKTVLLLSGVMFIAAFVTAGLDHRFSWIVLPDWVSYAAVALFLLGYAMYAEVLRENAYLSRTIKVSSEQTVIDKGLYGVVRHPMYSSTVIMFLNMPLILGSVISFGIMLLYIPIIALRIKNEEAVLSKELPGYEDYKKRVRYRMIPFVW